MKDWTNFEKRKAERKVIIPIMQRVEKIDTEYRCDVVWENGKAKFVPNENGAWMYSTKNNLARKI
jgi:hypothetical protein